MTCSMGGSNDPSFVEKVPVIESAESIDDNYRVLNAWLTLNHGGGSQGFGGYPLYPPKSNAHHDLKSLAGHFIWRVLEVAGVAE